ncbi:MAG: preprotein translocase subunit SecA [Chloroflexi bacterium]|nr:preprotein translocase subunit SecA [Chloroflexota bacterium]
MLKNILKKLFGDSQAREVQRLQPLVDQISALEPEMQRLDDAGLRRLTGEFRARLSEVTQEAHDRIAELTDRLDRESDANQRRALRAELERTRDGLDKAERGVLDEILPQAFAAVREASVRTVGLRHFDVQMIGGIVLHQGRIAEMKTGEGKTLVATLPLYLNALTGRGVHLVTPNDYLSKRGAQWMGPIYHLLGLTVGVVQSMGENPALSSFLFDPQYSTADDRYQYLRPCSRAEAYRADIVYGTNNEFGFDYLRDNMVLNLRECVQRELYFAIVDEVDNILIDEARTPLIISGQAEESTSEYRRFAALVRNLRREQDYTVDEKLRVVTITDEGINKVERALGIDNLYAPEHSELTPYLENALKAKALFTKDRDYVVDDGGEVIIVDEFTGRMMYGRRYSDGLHQAIEAKEGVQVRRESLTLATITFQNYFRMYRRLGGMTGTAATEAEEFHLIYNLDVVAIPTHRPMIRKDYADVVYRDSEAKFRAALAEIKERHEQQQPVLVGTLAIETSEMISQRLTRMGIPHQVLNAKQHEREAQVIAQAGRPGTVTIATNMAGRGVDILLGGNPEGLARDDLRRRGQDLQEIEPEVWQEALARAEEQCARERAIVLAAGGLHVLGTERYEARRIDNQLRGRAGRMGDPGSSRLYVSLEDDLMRRFGGASLGRIMDRFGVDEDTPIEHDLVTKSLEGAQTRVEGHNFDLRKHLLEYDDVVNQQRQVIYEQRRLILSEADPRPIVEDILQDKLRELVASYTSTDDERDWDLDALHAQVDRMIHVPAGHTPAAWRGKGPEEISADVIALAEESYDLREETLGADDMRSLEIMLMLGAIDRRWVRHLTALDELREGIGLRAIGQRNPLVEYKREAFVMFEQLMGEIQSDVAQMILNAQVQHRRPLLPVRNVQYAGASGGSAGSERQPTRSGAKVGRNDPCPCGSGKKYKQCCMREGLSPEEAAAKRAPATAGRR